jgi:hypothetical protein
VASNSPSLPGGGGTGGDLIFDHNTFIATNGFSELAMFDGSINTMQLQRVVFSNNIFDNSSYGFTALTGSYNNWASVGTQATPLVGVGNVLIGSADSTLPTGNYKPASDAAVGFTSYGSTTLAAGYALTSGSAYHAAGKSGANLPYTSPGTSDGTDLGCNIALLPTS